MGNEWELEDPARSSHESSSTLSFHWLCYKTGVVTAPCLLPWTGQGGAQLYRPARVRAQPWVTQPGSEHSPALGKLCTVVPLPRRGQGASCRNGGGGRQRSLICTAFYENQGSCGSWQRMQAGCRETEGVVTASELFLHCQAGNLNTGHSRFPFFGGSIFEESLND